MSRGCTFSALNTVYCYDKKCRPASCSCRRRGNGKARSESTYQSCATHCLRSLNASNLVGVFCHFFGIFFGWGRRSESFKLMFSVFKNFFQKQIWLLCWEILNNFQFGKSYGEPEKRGQTNEWGKSNEVMKEVPQWPRGRIEGGKERKERKK